MITKKNYKSRKTSKTEMCLSFFICNFIVLFLLYLSYRQTNPEASRHDEMANPEEWYETDSQRELGQIFSGQSKMFDALRDIQRKMDEIVGRQERTLGLMSAIQSNQNGIQY